MSYVSRWLWLLPVVLIPLLFIGGADSYNGRLNKEIWDLGHVPLFASLAILFLGSKPISRLSCTWLILLIGTLLGSLITGILIELLQFFVGRSLEAKDVLSDVLGGGIGFLVHTVLHLRLTIWQRLITYLSTAILSVLALVPISLVLIDMYFIKQNYPVLADFETPFELSRWEASLAMIERSEQTVRFGKYSLKVKMYPGDFSDITMFEMSKDWRDFKYLKFSVFNGLDHNLQLELKVCDTWHHQNGSRYSDRYNREITIVPLWNEIAVPIEDILNAPQTRKMDLSQIKSLSLFATNLDNVVEFYVDGFYLSNKQ